MCVCVHTHITCDLDTKRVDFDRHRLEDDLCARLSRNGSREPPNHNGQIVNHNGQIVVNNLSLCHSLALLKHYV